MHRCLVSIIGDTDTSSVSLRTNRRGASVKRCRELIGTLRFVKPGQVVNDVSRRDSSLAPGAVTYEIPG